MRLLVKMLRFISAAIISAVLSVIFSIVAVKLLKKFKLSQTISGYVTEHSGKNGTPTMGGVIFVLPCIVVLTIFAKGESLLATVAAAVFVAYATVGFIDDFIKIKFHRNEGLTPWQKIIFQLFIAVFASAFVCRTGLYDQFIPFTNVKISFGWWFLPVGVLVFLSSSNCVNLTDGLDGLAATTSAVYLVFSAALIFLQKKYVYADAAATAEYENLILLCVTCAAALGGFLLFNTNKASVFMGDTGSLALGGLLSAVLMISGNTFYIPIIGVTFVLSGLSVIIQVMHYKRTKKRVFLMAPLHHHFQHKGYSEAKIVFAYKLITVLAGLVSLIAYL